jgi:hypothetical protein
MWDMMHCELMCSCWRSEGVAGFVFVDVHEESDVCFVAAKIFLGCDSV